MSLTSILKEIDRVNLRHQEIQRRYNRKSKACPRQEDLEREELEDQRIYGYSHSHILQMFKQNKCENMEETRPCTAVQSRPFTTGAVSRKQEGNIRRAQSAVKVASYKQQYNFLFKEDIFDDNYEMIKLKTQKDENLQENERRMSRMLISKCVPKTVKKMHSKSIKAERINFVKSFDQNLGRMQNKNGKKLAKTNKNFVFYNKKQNMRATINPFASHEDFFKLTKAPLDKQPVKKFKIILSSSLDNLKEQQELINQSQIERQKELVRVPSLGRFTPLMETNFIDLLPSKFYLTCIVMETLQSVRFKLALKNGSIILQDSKEVLNLGTIFAQLITNNTLVHLVFHTEEKQLIYQEMLINQSFKNIQNKQYEIILLMYYLKRFLMFDELSTFKSVQQSADLLIKGNLDLPDDFIDFVETFQTKVCRIYDKDQRLYQFHLKSALKNAISSIVAFKKQMGFGQKVVKLKQGTREQFKKYLYNWEYFYICFFLSPIPEVSTSQLNFVIFIIMKAPKNQSVKVALRVRPLNKRETEMNSPLCVQTKDNVLSIKKGADTKDFVFDYVFGIKTTQIQVYEACGFSLVENALEGFNGTVFAYGQTGAGKTFSMVGDYKNQEWKGIIPRGFDHVINAIQTSQNRRYVVRASFIEIYNEEIFDLLDMKGDVRKDLKESPQTGVFVKDLKTIPVKSVDEMFKLLDYGNKNRSVAQTNMNATSSRSHALFTVHIESIEVDDKIKASKLNFVDLAGSERQGKTGASGDTLKEGAKINLSLTALGNVINALVDGKKGGHIPYRDSKLTRMLQDSLGGNTKTLMIASVSPAEDNYDETVSTLRYAARARNIKNTPKVNQDPKDALIKEYMAEIERLKKQLGNGGVSGQIVETSDELLQELERAKEKEKELTQKQAELLEMKLKMKEMQELIMKKDNNPEVAKMAQKRKVEKKKVMKQEELNEYKLRELEQEEKNDLDENEAEDKKEDIGYWRNLAKRLKKKLKSSIQDKKDQNEEFEDERERLNECIRNMEGNLSFYKQIAEKFLSQSDLAALMNQSQFDYQTRAMTIPPFLLHDEKLSLPKTLKKHEVDDLWKQKRKGYKLEMLRETLPQLSNKSNVFDIPESKSSVFSKDYKQPSSTPFVQNRRILKYLNNDEKYPSKWSQASGETIFRNTHFKIRDTSNSGNKRSSINSRTKLQAISKDNKKVQTSQEKPVGRPLSRAKQLQPLNK